MLNYCPSLYFQEIMVRFEAICRQTFGCGLFRPNKNEQFLLFAHFGGVYNAFWIFRSTENGSYLKFLRNWCNFSCLH